MASKETLWLSGFAPVSQVLAYDRVAIEQVRQALEGDLVSDRVWLAPWEGRLRGHPRELRELKGTCPASGPKAHRTPGRG